MENEIKARLELTLIYKNVFVSFSHMGGAATYFGGAATYEIWDVQPCIWDVKPCI